MNKEYYKDKSLKYYPKRFDKNNHGGDTKANLLKKLTIPGWIIELVEDSLIIPREGQGKTIGGRIQIEAGLSPDQYIEKLANDPIYKHESGQTIESQMAYAITELFNQNQITDDFQGNGNINYLAGNYQTSSGYLPNLCWSRGNRQASLGRDDPRRLYELCGLRPAVGVGVGV